MSMKLTDYIKQLPKADLHVHLDGSIRLETLIEFSKKVNNTLPSYTQSGLLDLVYCKKYRNLSEYLAGFSYTINVLKNPEHLEQSAYELACDSFDDGVCYIEVRFAPQIHLSKYLPTSREAIKAIEKGLNRAQKEINTQKQSPMPPFKYGIITCAMRSIPPTSTDYFGLMLEQNRRSTLSGLLQTAAQELALDAIKSREEDGCLVVGFDVAGEENGWDAHLFAPAYKEVSSYHIHGTAHAGEDLGPESILQAITALNVERIGHALHLFDQIDGTTHNQHREALCTKIVHLIHARSIAIETCPSSNMQTCPALKNSLKNHVLPHLLKHKIPAVICSDNRLISRTTISNEYEIVARELALSKAQLVEFALAGFIYSFFAEGEAAKSDYLSLVKSFINKLSD